MAKNRISSAIGVIGATSFGILALATTVILSVAWSQADKILDFETMCGELLYVRTTIIYASPWIAIFSMIQLLVTAIWNPRFRLVILFPSVCIIIFLVSAYWQSFGMVMGILELFAIFFAASTIYLGLVQVAER